MKRGGVMERSRDEQGERGGGKGRGRGMCTKTKEPWRVTKKFEKYTASRTSLHRHIATTKSSIHTYGLQMSVLVSQVLWIFWRTKLST